MKKKKQGVTSTQVFILLFELIILCGLLIYIFSNDKLHISMPAHDRESVSEKSLTEKIVDSAKKKIVNEVVDEVAEQIVIEQAVKQGISEEEAKEAIEAIDESDKEIVTDIIAEHLDADAVGQGIQYASDGDSEALEQMLQSELSPEEREQLMDIYYKYISDSSY